MKRQILAGQSVKSGVYKITNTLNGKFYIGCTKHMSSRYRTHLSSLKRNISKCTILQNAVNKYGIGNFIFEVIEICDNYQERETYYINTIKPQYNIVVEQQEKRGISKETIIKMSESQKNRWINNPIRGYKVPHYKRDSRFKIILAKEDEVLEFNSAKDVAAKFNTCIQAVFNAIKINCKYKGYIIKKQLKE